MSKVITKSKNLNKKIKKKKKSPKSSKYFKNNFLIKKFSLFLNIRTTQFDQSSPVQSNPERKMLFS